MTAAIVQSKHSDFISAGATTIALTFDSSVTAGNSIYVFVVRNGTPAATCADGASPQNTFTEFGTQSSAIGGQTQTAFYYDDHPGGATTVTVTFPVSETYRCMWIVEVSGADSAGSIDQWRHDTISSPGTGTDAIATGNITPSQDDSLLLAWFSDASGFNNTLTAGTGWTDEDRPGNDDGTAIGESRTQTTAAAINATATQTLTHNWIGTIVSIKPAAATTHEGSLSFAVDAGLTLASDMVLEASVSFANQLDEALSADANLEASQTFSKNVSMTLSADAVLEAAYSEQVVLDFSSTLGSILEGALALDVQVSETLVADISLEGALSLAVTADQSQSADASLEASQSFVNELAVSIINDAVLAAGLSLDAIADVSYAYDAVSVTVLTPDGRTLVINAQNRIKAIESEDRILSINSESRVLKVQ